MMKEMVTNNTDVGVIEPLLSRILGPIMIEACTDLWVSTKCTNRSPYDFITITAVMFPAR